VLRLVFALALVVPTLAGAAGGSFSIAVLPDTQNMIDYRHQKAKGFPIDAAELFLGQMGWIADRSAARGGDVAFVAAVGDVWQHQSLAIDPEHAGRGFAAIENPWFARELEHTPHTAGVELPTARRGYALLAQAGIPFGVAPGNHDYDAMWSDSRYPPVKASLAQRAEGERRPEGGSQIDMTPKTLGLLHVGGLDNFRSVFGADSTFFAGKPWYVASHAGGTSSAQTFSAGGYTFVHLALEMSPDDAVIAWAKSVIGAHPGIPTIVSTHDYLDAKGERRANPIIDLAAVDPHHNDAEDLWRELIAPHDQIFLVLSGHHHGVARRRDANTAGHEVHQLLADYQDRGQASLDAGAPRVRGAHGLAPTPIGDGWLRLLTFDTSAAVPTLRVRTYSPHYRAYADELETYAAWYKAHEEPAMDDAAFVAEDAFTLELADFRARFGPPR
jgi:hypothetical protein